MDDVNEFEARFRGRVRQFATSGIRPVDAAAVARAVVGARQAGLGAGAGLTWQRRRLVRRLAWVAVAAAAIVALTAVLPFLPGTAPGPSPTPTAVPTRLGLAYWDDAEDIYAMDWERGQPVLIRDDDPSATCAHVSSIAVSPDGRWIAYRTGVYGPGISGFGDCPAVIHVMDLAGREIASFPGWGETDVKWSPDSSMIATWPDDFWPRTPDPRGSPVIAIYGLDGERRALVDVVRDSGEYDVGWSEDGLAVFNGKYPSVDFPIDGSPARRPGDQPAWIGSAWSAQDALAAPDGQHVAVVTEASLIVATPDGSTVREFALARTVGVARATWAPSSDAIVYAQGSELRRVDVESGATTTLTVAEGAIFPILGFSPDGDWLLFVAGKTADVDGEVWVVSASGGEARRIGDGVTGAGWIALPPAEEGP